MYTEENFIMISALQHYVYCPRQCGLIHVEDAWHENLFTTRGNIFHEKSDTDTFETRSALRTVRGLRIHSYTYGLTGRCDVIEFYADTSPDNNKNVEKIYPVEYKSGKPKDDISDKVQLCAQALCLEEMMQTAIEEGAFFYGKTRRREKVKIDRELRDQTIKIIQSVRDIITSKQIPKAEYSQRCRNCSLNDICQPKAMNKRKLQNYIKGLYTS